MMPVLGRLQRTPQRGLIAGMRHGARDGVDRRAWRRSGARTSRAGGLRLAHLLT